MIIVKLKSRSEDFTEAPIRNSYGCPQVEKRESRLFFQLGQWTGLEEVEVSKNFYDAFVLEFANKGRGQFIFSYPIYDDADDWMGQ